MPSNMPAESLSLPRAEAQFEEALHYELTDEDIERASLLIGIDTPAGSVSCTRWRRPTTSGTGLWGWGTTILSTPRRSTGHAVGLPDRPRHHGRSREDPDARRPDAGGDQEETKSLFRGVQSSCRVARGTGSALSDPGDDLLVCWRGEPRRQGVRVCRTVSRPDPSRRCHQPARRGRRRVPHPPDPDRAEDGP